MTIIIMMTQRMVNEAGDANKLLSLEHNSKETLIERLQEKYGLRTVLARQDSVIVKIELW